MQRFKTAFFLIVFLVVPAVALAQTSRGTVTGTVTDPSGAVVPDATVTLLNTATNAPRETKTNAEGIYRFDAVDLGTYDLTVKAPGFRNATRAGITVQANRTVGLDLSLELGTGAVVVTVEATSVDLLQTTEPVHGGNFIPRQIVQLPLQSFDSINLVLLLPGAQNASTTDFSNGSNQYSVNGQRARGNNFLIDGVENNDISVAGPAYQITNNDAIQEVAVQTTQFSAEFGRASGAVVNQITKSGTNQIHGTVSHYYLSQLFDATDAQERAGAAPGDKLPPVYVQNIPAFTIGGPVYFPKLYDGRNRTFFFGAAQWDRFFATALSSTRRVPTEAGVTVLQSLSAACPNVALYLQALGNFRGNPASSPSNISIAIPSATFATTGSCNGTDRAGVVVQTGLVSEQAAQSVLDNNHQIRIDHVASNKQNMSFRWLYDRNVAGPYFNNLPGFDYGFAGRTMTMAFTDTYVISTRWTNEFRFNYGRIGLNFPSRAPDPFHADLPNFTISGVTGFGVATNMPQYRFANNWQYQDTMTFLQGRHTLRFGVDFLRQLARQRPPFNERGSYTFNSSTGVTGLANFIDDFGGSAGSINRQFGVAVYYPNLFRQAYFFQDNWKVSSSLTLNLGLRYENFGQPANIFLIPAFTNYDPVNFAEPNEVKRDDNNFGPVVGFAWNPSFDPGFLRTLMGDRKTVWRGGFQVTYDTFFNNLLSNMAGSSPNTLGGVINSLVPANGPRGRGNMLAEINNITPTPPTALSPQTSLFDPNIRNPYAMRWSFGFQRELPVNLMVDLSYVGTAGRKLFRTLDMNPFLPTGVRFMPAVGQRTIRASIASSTYHSLQLNVRRRYAGTPVGNLLLDGSYTWSRSIDNVSEVFGTDSTYSAYQSVPQVLGGDPRIDRGVSDFDRSHRLVLSYVWEIRGPKTGLWGHVAGGWNLSGVTQFVTGAPFTVRNGFDRNGDGQSGPDRPEISNLSAPITSRAQTIATATCPSGLAVTPLTSPVVCTTADAVRWIAVSSATGATNIPIGASTAGRNILRTPGMIQFDLNVIKGFRITESVKFEYRAEIFNLFNRINRGINFPTVPGLSVGTSASFLDYDDTEARGRSIRMQLKLTF